MKNPSAAQLGLLVSLVATASGVAAQPPPALSEREEVTAVDVVVELTKNGEPLAELPDKLTPENFTVEEGGVPLAVVGVESREAQEHWSVLLYFDLELSSTLTTRRAASALAERAADLVALGPVSVVTAGLEPTLLLAPTRDPDLLDQSLSGIYLGAQTQNRVLALREDFLVQRREEPELSRPEVIRALIVEERRIVRARQDALLEALVEELPGTARRVLFLVSDGFDEDPERFYMRYSAVDQGGEELGTTGEWAETVAAYGWTVIAMPQQELEEPKEYGAEPAVDERTWSLRFPGISSRLEGGFDPERAASLHELGQRYEEQDKLAEAEATLREALSFYHGNPKFARQRASVLADLGRVLERLDRSGTARAVIRQAAALDPEIEQQFPFLAARLEAAMAPLEALADASVGRVVASDDELAAALSALASRVRLTFQFRGDPDGETHRVAVDGGDGTFEVRGPVWVRFGTPPAVSALRARRLLAGEFDREGLEVKCRFVEGERRYAERQGELEIVILDTETGARSEGLRLRVTVAIAREEGLPRMLSREITTEASPNRLPLTVSDDEIWLGLVVDHPASGRWGGASAEL